MSSVPESRVRNLNGAPVRADGQYVLYWMVAARRAHWNFALDRAVELAREMDRSLIVLEALRADYPWANARHHRFVLDGMKENVSAFEGTGVLYYPYVEPEAGAGKGLVETLAREACAVVTDDFPAFFLTRMLASAAKRLPVRIEAVDSNGLLPLCATNRVFKRAFDFRRFLQQELAPYLEEAPKRAPLRARLRPQGRPPVEVATRWPQASPALLDGEVTGLRIDQGVAPAPQTGGARAAKKALRRFLAQRLKGYDGDRNQLEVEGTSGLSPYLHFGHLSVHEVFADVAKRERWSPEQLAETRTGKRTGWWGMSTAAESYLDQLVTWRELGFQFCARRPDYERFDSLPDWARRTLAEHAGDERPRRYDLEQFEAAQTSDELWNAAQNQLRAEGRIQGYMRMLWGKKILHWSESPEAALEIMIELNNKYALDGRDPNSYSGIFWVLGRFDRAWGPEREVFGKIRYMSSRNTRRKMRVEGYLRRWNGH